LAGIIQGKVKRQLKDMFTKGTVKDFDKSQERLDELNRKTGNIDSGINPLGNFDKDKFQKLLDENLDIKASEEIMTAVMATRMGTNSFSNLEKSLKGWLDRKKIGSREGEEAQNTIKKIIEEVRDNLGNTTEDNAKKVMLSVMLTKFKK